MNDDMTASISLQEWLDLKSKCAALTLERDAAHMAWKADVEACEAEVKQWKSGCEKEYTRAQVLTAEVEALKAERFGLEHRADVAEIFAEKSEIEAGALRTLNDGLKAQIAEYKRDVERYRWWRENIGIIEQDGDGIAGVAYSFQIPLHGLNQNVPEQTDGDLMDAIANAALAATGEKQP